MKRDISIYKAQGIADGEIPSVTINLDIPFPKHSTTESAIMTHEINAVALAEILYRTLPGGTLDRLTAILLRKKATNLVVPFGG